MTTLLLLIVIVMLAIDIHDHRRCSHRQASVLPIQAAERRIRRLVDDATLDMLDEIRRAWMPDDSGDAA